ncbi:MAG: hypothetical protein HZB99_03375 [Candidatus Harrisonbacteria bacterium]|nr:hypothetical protein [Candidatus Harrisonbacteria bacterium]
MKKLIRLLPIIPLLAWANCKEKEIDQQLIDHIWQEVMKIAELPPDTPKPVIEFINGNDVMGEKAHGRYYWNGRKAEIYIGQLMEYIWNSRDRYGKYGAAYGYDISYYEAEALLYNTVAHEMLHYAIHVREETTQQHRIMRDRQYLSKVIDVISDHFKLHHDGLAKYLSLQFLDYGIYKDEKTEGKNKSSSKLPPNIHADTEYGHWSDCW